MNNVLIVNVFDHHFVVTERKQGKKTYRDSLAMGVCTGTVFDSIYYARDYAQELRNKGPYKRIVEIKYAKHLLSESFDIWVVTHKKFRVRYSVFLSSKMETLSRSEVLERAIFGKHFSQYSSAMKFATDAAEQANRIFGNDDSTVLERTIVEVDPETDITYDNHGEPVYLCEKPLWRSSELEYQYIDVIEYSAAIQRISDSYSPTANPSSDLGTKAAYDFAIESAIPLLRSEIYRAEKLLALLKEDVEENKEDIDFYTAYAQTLSECIDIQKQHRLPDNFRLTAVVYDESGIIKPVENGYEKVVNAGAATESSYECDIPYDIVVYDDRNLFLEAVNADQRQPLFAAYGKKNETSSYAELQQAVYEKTRKALFLCREPKHIRKYFSQFVLLSVGLESIIDDEWICEETEEVCDDCGDCETDMFSF